MNKKKILYIVAGALLVLLVGLGVYAFFFAGGSSRAPRGSAPPPGDITTDTLQDREDLRLLSANPVAHASLSSNGELVTVSPRGVVQLLGSDGTVLEELADLDAFRIGEVSVDATTPRAALEIIEADGSSRWVVASSAGISTLPNTVEQVAFSAQGLLARVQSAGETREILLGEPGEAGVIFGGSFPDLRISWVDERTLALSTAPSGMAAGVVYLLDTRTERLTRLLGATFGLTAHVSPSQDGVLFFRTNAEGRSGELVYRTLPSGEERAIAAPTLPERCAFSQDTRFVYCSVFMQSIKGHTMPDDYYKGSVAGRQSRIVKINLATGTVEQVGKTLSFDAANLVLSPQETYLFVTSRGAGTLYRLEL